MSDVEARWALVAPHREHMLAVARRRCATEQDAEDCVHEAMLRVAEFDKLDPARVAALLTSVVTRLAVDMHRRRARERRYQPRLVRVPEQQAPPDEAVLDAGEALWLAGQLPLLPERERAVLAQRIAGFSAAEAATRLGLTYKSTESAFTRARGRMRMWAGAGVLIVAEHLRRLRTHPASTWAAMAMVSAGCWVLSTAQQPAGRTSEDAHASARTVSPATMPGGASFAPPASVTATGHPSAASPPQRGRSRWGADDTAPARTWHDVYHATVPVAGNDTTVGVGQSTGPGSFQDALAACVAQTSTALQRLDTRSVGCPS